MPSNRSRGWVLFACTAAVWGCGDGRSAFPISPVAPSVLTSGRTANSSVTGVAPQYVDNDGDGYEDPEPGPMPEPGQTPAPQVPAPDPGQLPVVVTVNIVGSSGTAAFAPNPAMASVGNTMVWMNNDLRPHNIVLNDGTIVGNLAPGQTSPPIPLTSTTVSYICTIHPSMVGQIRDPAAMPPATPDPSQNPAPDPSAYPEPEDPYADPYYLRFDR